MNMVDMTTIQNLAQVVDEFESEAKAVYDDIVKPRWNSPPWWQRLPRILYGCVMHSFARIDLLSMYWRGDASTRGQTKRMVDFIEHYLEKSRRASNVAVHIWRHQLAHAGEPRPVYGEDGKLYRWLLHWDGELPKDQHFTLAESGGGVQLNMAFFYLVQDLKGGLQRYKTDLVSNTRLRENLEKAGKELNSYRIGFY